jgi:hypothetical protein
MNAAEASQNPSDFVLVDSWLKSVGRTRGHGAIGWRERFPWLKTIKIFGKLYISRRRLLSSSAARWPVNSLKTFIPRRTCTNAKRNGRVREEPPASF